MGVRSRSKRNRRRRASDVVGGADLISGLGDDVLVRILELLPDAGDAVRTGALSRRWRGLWTRVSSLTFDSSSRCREFGSASNDRRFLHFVHNALAERAKADAALDLEHLAISFAIMSRVDDQKKTKPLVRRSTDAAQQWISYAIQKPVKSFLLKLQLFPIWNCIRSAIRCKIFVERPMIDLINLPSSAKLETVHWELQGVRLQLPATAVFTSLVDLSLENIELVASSGHLLARLVSSACWPSLRKLQLRDLWLDELNDELLIEARALLELSMSNSRNAGLILKLKTPSLRILHLENYVHLIIFAPRLEELTFLPSPPDLMEVDGELPCVGSLKIELASHGDEHYDINSGSICLLQCCTSLTCLEVSLKITMEEEYWVADIISGRIPHLRHLISLTVHIDSSDLHSFGVGLSEILKQCSYLKYLSVHCSIHTPELHNVDFLCDHLDYNKSHHVYLANIQEARFTGLAWTNCESSFIQGVLAHATQLQKVALRLDPRFRLYSVIDCSTFIPCGGGTWVCHDPSLSYEWSCDPISK